MKPFKKIASVLGGVIIGLLIAEVVLRMSGYYRTYMEKRTGEFYDLRDYDHSNVYGRLTPNIDFYITAPEYNYFHHSNSMGFDDKEFNKRTDSSEIRILCLGDSFTEGDGAPTDSTYPKQLQDILRANLPGKKITVFNGGIRGSDPVFNTKCYLGLLKNTVDPDIIVQTISSQDLTEDMIVRGGFERFKNDSTVQFNDRLFKWTKLYQYVFLSRLIFKVMGYNDLFINTAVLNQQKPVTIKALKQIQDVYKNTLADGRFVIFMFEPGLPEIQNQKWGDYSQSIIDSIIPGMGKLDYFDYGYWLIHCSNVKQEDLPTLFWKKDGHHNSKGYHVMATSVANYLLPLIQSGKFHNLCLNNVEQGKKSF
ncbi:MAG TPA: SGNH/GDSL hydrolase family protein [Chitinophagales bacterium]|nr:SGNH/GDSL hydrolase family protein [Chitinophagales bacterium]